MVKDKVEQASIEDIDGPDEKPEAAKVGWDESNKSTAVAVDENEQLVTTVKTQELDDFGPEDVQMPWLRLMQGLSEAVTNSEAQSGQWMLDGFEPLDEVQLVVGSAGKYRNLREKETRDIICIASDGRTGRGDPGGDCSVCPHSRWTENESGGRMLPPACSEGYSFLVYSITDEMVGRLQLERTGLQAAKSLIRDSKAAGGFGSRVFRLNSRHVTRSNRSYYQAQVKVIKDAEVPDGVAEIIERLSV